MRTPYGGGLRRRRLAGECCVDVAARLHDARQLREGDVVKKIINDPKRVVDESVAGFGLAVAEAAEAEGEAADSS